MLGSSASFPALFRVVLLFTCPLSGDASGFAFTLFLGWRVVLVAELDSASILEDVEGSQVWRQRQTALEIKIT